MFDCKNMICNWLSTRDFGAHRLCKTCPIKVHAGFTCTNPESFVRGGLTLTRVFLEGMDDPSKCHYKPAIIGPPAKRHLNGVSLACR